MLKIALYLKRRTGMKKLVVILSAIALLAMLASCGAKVKEAKKVADNIPTVKLLILWTSTRVD